MKGIILCGGLGTRLYPVTKVVNKHILPIHNRPMFYWPLQMLINSGIKEFVFVSGPPFGNQIGKSLKILQKNTNYNFVYVKQKKPLGIPDAISNCKKFIGKESFIVSVGDNIFGQNLKKEAKNFKEGALACIRKVKDPQRHGIAEFESSHKLKRIVEKPIKTISNWAVTAPYVFDNSAFDKISYLKPSARGELEIVDLLTHYLREGKLQLVKRKDKWLDTGTFDSLLEASNVAKNLNYKFTI